MQVVDADLRKFKKVKEWLREEAASLFGTDGSWEWFKRTHRTELLEGGVLIIRLGRAGDLVDADAIGRVVQTILMRESLARLTRSKEMTPDQECGSVTSFRSTSDHTLEMSGAGCQPYKANVGVDSPVARVSTAEICASEVS